MAYPEISLSCVASVYVRQIHFVSAGDVETGHEHCFDHQTLVAKGSVQIEVDGAKTVYNAPHIIFIKKNTVHELTAMEDDTVCYCIHALQMATMWATSSIQNPYRWAAVLRKHLLLQSR